MCIVNTTTSSFFLAAVSLIHSLSLFDYMIRTQISIISSSNKQLQYYLFLISLSTFTINVNCVYSSALHNFKTLLCSLHNAKVNMWMWEKQQKNQTNIKNRFISICTLRMSLSTRNGSEVLVLLQTKDLKSLRWNKKKSLLSF